ncbi:MULTISPECIES: AraC family transcriptional regulator [Paenibacillus]|uniref:Helix-turn-helix domain-containing protein n=1 Tax=Paenibacillus campinasensis TaxID=66347 RepID=A0ABW9SZ91_9BACL|nr:MULTISPECIES: AraC family transcriptional regulator [Paenibacillus]MUG65787.1 helix-turn-helix domain-containing protein [Paenibacillus campinasensis]PAK55702.1 AraC family transcriptional regulator [Paenibacillus sp. 7541]
MEALNDPERQQLALAQLAQLILRHTPSSGTHPTAVPSLSLMHAVHPSEPLESVYKPSICVVAQGAKTASLASEIYRYDPAHYLITSVELPIVGHIIEASPEVPYLSLKLGVDLDVIVDIVKEMQRPESDSQAARGITVNETSSALLEALVRLLQLLDTPEDIPVLAPLMTREIVYRVLQNGQGALLSQFAMIGSHAHNIAQAVQVLNREYDQPLSVEQLAKSVNMSVSAFHKHFKRVTAMSPLQYQKTVRLQEARRLMLIEGLQAADAAYSVGYESPSQFSREYARMYGQPPMSDMQRLREVMAATPSAE